MLSQAEGLLEVAAAGDSSSRDLLILTDRQGGTRMLEAAGWTLSAVLAEYGAEMVFRVERRGSRVRVEGWDGSCRCLVQRDLTPPTRFPAVPLSYPRHYLLAAG